MDIRMPLMDGLEATRRIAADERLAGVRVLVLTTFANDDNAIRVVAQRDALLSPKAMAKLGARDRAQLVVTACQSELVHPGQALPDPAAPEARTPRPPTRSRQRLGSTLDLARTRTFTSLEQRCKVTVPVDHGTRQVQLELRHITLVEAIARTGSINAAAREIGLSQPTVTAQLARLERHFGAALFVRSTTGTTPTAFGEHLVRSTRFLVPLLAEIDERLMAKPAESHPAPRSSLRIGTDHSPVTAGVVAVLSRTRPSARLHLQGDIDPADAIARIEQGCLEVAVGQRMDDEPAGLPGVRHKLLGATDLRLIVGAEHRLAGRGEVDLAGLDCEKWAFPPRHTACLRALRMMGHNPTVIAEVAEPMIHDLVRGGTAIGLTADPGPVNGIVQIPLTGRPLRTRHFLTWRADVLGDDEVTQIVQYARDRLSRTGDHPGSPNFG